MKLSEDVTREMLAGIIEQTLADMEEQRKEARAAYEGDKNFRCQN